MSDDFIRSIRQLDELIDRIDRHVNAENERPTWLHWSDVEVLRETRRRLVDGHVSLVHLQGALISSVLATHEHGA